MFINKKNDIITYKLLVVMEAPLRKSNSFTFIIKKGAKLCDNETLDADSLKGK